MKQSHHAISYIEISVADLARAREFYGQAFGWRFNDYGPDYAGIRSADGGGEVGGLGAAAGHRPGAARAAPVGRPRRERHRRRGGGREGRRGAVRVPRLAGGSCSPTRTGTCSASPAVRP